MLSAGGFREIAPAACGNVERLDVVRLNTERLILTGRFWTHLVYNTPTHHVAYKHRRTMSLTNTGGLDGEQLFSGGSPRPAG